MSNDIAPDTTYVMVAELIRDIDINAKYHPLKQDNQ
jgi:hypothetical protein